MHFGLDGFWIRWIRCLESLNILLVFTMSSRRLRDMASRSLEDVFNVTIFRLPKRFQDVFARRLQIQHMVAVWYADFPMQPFTDVFQNKCSSKLCNTGEPLSNNKVAGLLLQNTYGGCLWDFLAANTFLQLNILFIAASCTGFGSRLLCKQELNLRCSH